MRNVLLTFALLLTFGLSYGQIKVITSGYTGVGTTTPTAQLHVSQNVAGPEFIINNETTNPPDFTLQSQSQTKGQIKYIPNRNGMEFQVNATNTGNGGLTAADFVMHINGTGNKNVGIGTNSPTSKLEVNGNVSANNVLMGGGGTTSAKSLGGFDYGLETIMAMTPSKIDNKQSLIKRARTSFYALDAKKLETIAPEFVTVGTQIEYAEDANEVSKVVAEEEFYYINSSMVQLTLINAMQEQQAQIEAKDAKIADLEARLAAIEAAISAGTSTSVEVKDATLGQNAPNPFNEMTSISYAVPAKSNTATMEIYDMNGNLLKAVNVAKGNGTLEINAGELAAGTYSYRLVVDGQVVSTKKMVLTK